MGCFSAPESESQSTQVSTSSSYLPQQAITMDKALQRYTPEIGTGMDVYQGERVAPLTPNQTGVFDFAQGGGFVTSPEAVNKYFQTAIKAPAMQTFQEETKPAIKEAFSGPGYWSSARATEEARASENLGTELGRQKAELQWDTLQANKQGALQQYALGEAEQQYNQQQINASIQKFAEENQITDPTNLAILMNLLGISMSTRTATGTSTGESQGAGLGYSLAGSLVQGAATGASYGLMTG